MELVDAAGRVVADRRSPGGGPLLGGQVRVGQVDGDRAGRVRCQRRRVGVGDDVGLHASSAGYVDPHLPQVLAAGSDGDGGLAAGGARGGVGRGIRTVGDDPAAVAFADGRGASRRAGDLRHRSQPVAGLPGQEGDGLRGGCPQGEGGAAIVEGDAQLGAGGGLGVEMVQEDGGLHAGEGVEPGTTDVGVLGGVRDPDVLGDGDLAGQGGGDGAVVEQGRAGGVGRAQGDVALQVRVRGEDLAGQVPDDAQGRERRGGHAVRAQDLAVDGRGAAVGCRDETQGEAGAGEGVAGVSDDDPAVHPPGQQRQRPRQDGGGDPVGALLLAAGHGREGRGGVECAGERVGEGHGGVLPSGGALVGRRRSCRSCRVRPRGAGIGSGAAHLVVSPGRWGPVSPMAGIVPPGLRTPDRAPRAPAAVAASSTCWPRQGRGRGTARRRGARCHPPRCPCAVAPSRARGRP